MSLLMQFAERALNRPLMVHPDKLPLIVGVLEGRLQIGIEPILKAAREHVADMPSEAQMTMYGPSPTASRFVGSQIDEDPITGRRTMLPYRRTSDGVAIIPVIGTLINRGPWVGAQSGQTSYEGLKHQFAFAASDPRTTAILMDIDSPGGEAVGAFEAADAVRQAAAQKPVAAVVNGMAASAAYAIASAADRIWVTKTGVVGSIGVVMLHADYSRKLDKEGITPTLIFSGAHKVDGHPFAPLPEGVAADMQAECDQFYAVFVGAVASDGRMSEKQARETEARTFIGADAVSARLADEAGTFENALADLSQARIGASKTQRKVAMATTDKTGPDANSGLTNAEVDARVATARTEAHAAGRTEAETAGKATLEGAVTTAKTEATKAERDRVKAITSLPEAVGREAQALALALNTDMTADQAKAVLAASPKAAIGGRASESAIGLAVDIDPKQAATEAYTPEQLAKKINDGAK